MADWSPSGLNVSGLPSWVHGAPDAYWSSAESFVLLTEPIGATGTVARCVGDPCRRATDRASAAATTPTEATIAAERRTVPVWFGTLTSSGSREPRSGTAR